MTSRSKSLIRGRLYYLVIYSILFLNIYSILSLYTMLHISYYKVAYICMLLFFFSSLVMLLIKSNHASIGLLLVSLFFASRLSGELMISFDDYIVTLDFILIFTYGIIMYFVYNMHFHYIVVLYILIAAIQLLVGVIHYNKDFLTIIINGVLPQIMIIMYILEYLKTMQGFYTTTFFFKIISILVIGYGLIQPLLNFNGSLISLYSLRISSVFYSPVIFPIALLILWPLILINKPDKKINKYYSFIIFSIVFLTIALTQSKGALLILLIQTIYIIKSVYKVKHFLVKMIFFAFLLFFTPIFDLNIFSRIGEISLSTDTSTGERLLGIYAAVQFGLNNLIFGIGLGNFNHYFINSDYSAISGVDLESAHNYLLNIFAESGLIVTTIWLFIQYTLLRKILYGINNEKFVKYKYNLQLFFIALLGSLLYQILFGNEFFHLHNNVNYHNILYYSVFATSLAYMKLIKKESLIEYSNNRK